MVHNTIYFAGSYCFSRKKLKENEKNNWTKIKVRGICYLLVYAYYCGIVEHASSVTLATETLTLTILQHRYNAQYIEHFSVIVSCHERQWTYGPKVPWSTNLLTM